MAKKPPANFVDLTGQRFGKLVVSERAPSTPGQSATRWLCRCDCGRQKEARVDKLKANKTTSCGCSNPFRHATRVAVAAARCTEISALVQANDAIRRALDDELMARMAARC